MRIFIAFLFMSMVLVGCGGSNTTPPRPPTPTGQQPLPGTPGYGTPGYGAPGTPGYGTPGYGAPGGGAGGWQQATELCVQQSGNGYGSPNRMRQYCSCVYSQAATQWSVQQCNQIDCISVLGQYGVIDQCWGQAQSIP